MILQVHLRQKRAAIDAIMEGASALHSLVETAKSQRIISEDWQDRRQDHAKLGSQEKGKRPLPVGYQIKPQTPLGYSYLNHDRSANLSMYYSYRLT